MPEFSFLEFNPEEASDDLIQQTAAFFLSQVWHGQLQVRTDFLRSYHLALAVDEAGQLAAAGSMIGAISECHMAGIATAPQYRRHYRLGSTILQMLEDKAKMLGADTVSLWARTEARGFFEKHGYVYADLTGEDKGAMSKYLVQ